MSHLALTGQADTSQTRLGQLLGLDKTTLSRNLSLLRRNGWISHAPTPAPSPTPTPDRREKTFRLTPAGDTILNQTRPGWQRAQAKLLAALSPAKWQSMSEIVGQVAEAAIAARQLPTP